MKKYAVIAVVGIFVLGCENRSRDPNVELIQDMMVSPAVKSQDEDLNSMKLPPEGTIPQGWTPYVFQSAEEAALKLQNPIGKTNESVMKGRKLYMTYCFPCHGAKADGKGPVADKWPAPIPNLLTQRVRGWKDGHIYHLVTRGRGLMGSYASQIRPDDRWHLINYLRHSQANSPTYKDDGVTLSQ